MKRRLLGIILAVCTLFTCVFCMVGSGCDLLLGGKDEFTKKVDAFEKSCVISVDGISPVGNETEIMYMISDTRLYLYVDNGYQEQTAMWVAENGSYKYWVFNENTELFEEVPGKTKAEYENARKNSFYFMFGCLTKNSKEFEYNERDYFYSNKKPLVYTYNNVDISSALGQAAGTTIGTVYYTFDNIVIELDNEGNIISAEYQWVESYDVTNTKFIYECELEYNEYPIPHPDEINAG